MQLVSLFLSTPAIAEGTGRRSLSLARLHTIQHAVRFEIPLARELARNRERERERERARRSRGTDVTMARVRHHLWHRVEFPTSPTRRSPRIVVSVWVAACIGTISVYIRTRANARQIFRIYIGGCVFRLYIYYNVRKWMRARLTFFIYACNKTVGI